jgi:hypothetical protein
MCRCATKRMAPADACEVINTSETRTPFIPFSALNAYSMHFTLLRMADAAAMMPAEHTNGRFPASGRRQCSVHCRNQQFIRSLRTSAVSVQGESPHPWIAFSATSHTLLCVSLFLQGGCGGSRARSAGCPQTVAISEQPETLHLHLSSVSACGPERGQTTSASGYS